MNINPININVSNYDENRISQMDDPFIASCILRLLYDTI